jgi:hypothetical protein
VAGFALTFLLPTTTNRKTYFRIRFPVFRGNRMLLVTTPFEQPTVAGSPLTVLLDEKTQLEACVTDADSVIRPFAVVTAETSDRKFDTTGLSDWARVPLAEAIGLANDRAIAVTSTTTRPNAHRAGEPCTRAERISLKGSPIAGLPPSALKPDSTELDLGRAACGRQPFDMECEHSVTVTRIKLDQGTR